MIHAGGRLPFSWRYFANAYLPELLYRQGMLDTGRPFPELEAMSHINERALAVHRGEDFPARIREALPMPSFGAGAVPERKR